MARRDRGAARRRVELGFPTVDDRATLLIDESQSAINEYEDSDIDRLWELFGDFPKTSLYVEMRRSRGNKAVDDAVELTRRLLTRFEGVADDGGFGLWTLAEIEGGVVKASGGFLDYCRPSRGG